MNDQLKDLIKVILGVDKLDRSLVLKDHADSLARAELITEVELALGVQLTNIEITSIKTYGALEDLIKEKSGK